MTPNTLKHTARGPLVLLFYDGYDRRAKPGLSGMAYSQVHRLLRYTKKTLCRQQVRTGFYTAFLALENSLRLSGCDVRINDFATANKYPDYPIGLAGFPSVLAKTDSLPNPRIFGPGDFGMPEGSAAVANDSRFKKLIQPSDWFADVYRPYCGDKMLTWFAGIDTNAWPDFSNEKKTYDFIVYDKIRWQRDERVSSVLNRITAHLDKKGHRHITLRYGHHHHSEFMLALRLSKALLFVCEHETQGLAYQEAMSANLPVLAWDEEAMVDPTLQPYITSSMHVSAVPYFSDTCGMKFKIGEFEQVCDTFWQRLPSFRPREYVENHLSLELSAAQYLAAYAALIRA